jgi:hypothetical protein
MSAAPIPDRVIDQLEANLRAAQIPATPADIEGILAKGFLSRVAAFEQLIATTPADLVPDSLRDSTDGRSSPAYAQLPELGPDDPAGAGDIGAIAARLRARQVSPVELTEQALARIVERDPELNAFQLVLADQARAAAKQAEKEIASMACRLPSKTSSIWQGPPPRPGRGSWPAGLPTQTRLVLSA